MFITFEGVDGSGKTTQAALLVDALRAEGREVVATREPGGTPVGEQIRDLLLHGDAISPWTEAALFAAARAQLVADVIRPALDRGADVVCDRFLDSSLAYQGIARGLGVDRVLELNVIATGGLLPDRTFLLELPLDQAKARLGDEPDRMESEGDGFAGRVQGAYGELAQIFQRRVVPIDATKTPEEQASEIRAELRDLS